MSNDVRQRRGRNNAFDVQLGCAKITRLLRPVECEAYDMQHAWAQNISAFLCDLCKRLYILNGHQLAVPYFSLKLPNTSPPSVCWSGLRQIRIMFSNAFSDHSSSQRARLKSCSASCALPQYLRSKKIRIYFDRSPRRATPGGSLAWGGSTHARLSSATRRARCFSYAMNKKHKKRLRMNEQTYAAQAPW